MNAKQTRLSIKSEWNLLLTLSLPLASFPLQVNALTNAPCNVYVPCPDQHDRPLCTNSCGCPPGAGGPGNRQNTPNPTTCGSCGPNRSIATGNTSRFSAGAAMPVFWVSEPRLNVRVEDEPLGYDPAVGRRVSFTLSYRQRGAVDFAPEVFGVGTNWSCSFRACVADLGGSLVRLHRGGSGWLDYSLGSPQFYDGSVATAITGGFQIEDRNGSIDVFTNLYTDFNGTHFYFLSSQRDPSGNTTTYTYASGSSIAKLLSVQDPSGKTTQIFYEDPTFTNQITKVVDPFNRTNILQYNSSGILSNSTDVAGLLSYFLYDTSNGRSWLTNMTTPYGTTSFRVGGLDADAPEYNATTNQVNRFVEVTLPSGGKELYLFRLDCSDFLSSTYSPVPVTEPLPNTLDNVDEDQRNSFHWGPLQYDGLSSAYRSSGNVSNLTAPDYALGRLRHWLAVPKSGTPMPSDALSLERASSPDGTTPGQLTWYDYDNKSWGNNYAGPSSLPSFNALVLPDSATRFAHNTYGNHGEITQQISTYTAEDGSAALRTNTFVYAGNEVDLLQEIGPQNEQIVSNYFNSVPHQPDASYDALNQETLYTYNANFQVTSIKLPTGLTTTNIYFASGTDAGRLDKTIDREINRTNTYTYSNGLIYSHTDERGLRTTNSWDNLQRLIGVLYPDGTTISNVYTNLDVIATKDRLGYWTYFGFNRMRQKIAETNANGVVTRYDYCDCGALRSVTNAWNTPVQQATSFGYDRQGNLTYSYFADNYNVTNWYNSLGQLFQTGDGPGYRNFYYNNQGLMTNVGDANGIVRRTVFDIEDRPIQVTDANGVLVTNAYDLLGRLTTRGYPDGETETFGYSARGLTVYTNQLGSTNFYAYDEASRKTFETNANAQLIRYTNNAASDLLTLADGKNQTTRWGYDEYGRVTNKLDQAGTEILRYTYDPDGRLTNRWSAAKGNTVYTYDAVGNLTSSPDATFQYDWLNRLTNMVDGIGTTKYTYTAGNQVLTEDGPFASDTVTNTYVNRLRTRLDLQQPTGVWTNVFTYDAGKRLTNVVSPAGSFAYTLGGTAPSSALIKKLLLPNTSYITNTFDNVARVKTTSLKNSGGTVLDSYAYLYDPAGERTNLTRADSSTVAFRYDKIGQLTVADSSVPIEDHGYTYDAAWNLNWRTNKGSLSQFIVDDKNELTNAPAKGTIQYDSNGNMTGNSAPDDFSYDNENRLIEAGIFAANHTTQFHYDGFGRLRQRRDIDGIVGPLNSDTWCNYIYDGSRVIQERDFNNVPMVSYTRGTDLSGSLEGAGGIGGLLARSHGYNGSTGNWATNSYYFADGNGNVTYMINSSQAMVASYRYDPFGNAISKNGTLADLNTYRFSSKEVSTNTGMYYYGYRFYDPSLQRWVTRDPIQETGGINLYGYMANDPINAVDPYGLRDYGSGANNLRATGMYPSSDKDFYTALGITFGGLLGAGGAGALADAVGASILGYFGLGAAAAESPQGQKACQAAAQEGNAILEKLAKLEDAVFQANMKRQIAYGQFWQSEAGSVAQQNATSQMNQATAEFNAAKAALDQAKRGLGN